MESNFISLKNASELLGVAPHVVCNLIKEQKIIGIQAEDSNRWQVDRDSLDQYRKTDVFKRDLPLMRTPQSMTVKEAIEDVEELFEGDVITYAMRGGIIESQDAVHLNNLLSTMNPKWAGSEGKKFNSIVLVLHSSGGSLEAAIKLVGIIKTYARIFEVIVPLEAKSAATIISLKADTLYLTPVSELGPVDPMVQSPSNPTLRVPAHVIEQFINHYGSHLNQTQKNPLDEILIEKLNKTIDPYMLGAYKAAQDFARQELCECFDKYDFSQDRLQAIKDLFLNKKSHSYPILYSDLSRFGIGKIIEGKEKLNSVNILMAVFNNYMISNNAVKVLGNRDVSHNVIAARDQVIRKTNSSC
jgi:hypothetical protein